MSSNYWAWPCVADHITGGALQWARMPEVHEVYRWHSSAEQNIEWVERESQADEIYKSQMRFKHMGGYLLSPSARDPVYAQRYPGKSRLRRRAEGRGRRRGSRGCTSPARMHFHPASQGRWSPRASATAR